MVECECKTGYRFDTVHQRFNRYMVECELYDKVIASFPALGF